MKRIWLAMVMAGAFLAGTDGVAQVVLSGRLRAGGWAEGGAQVPLAGVYCFASLNGPGSETRSFRTWETEPAGWFRLEGAAGNYTTAFSHPSSYGRPVVWNNLLTRPGEVLEHFQVLARLDYAVFEEGTWDTKPARAYYQPFVARSRSVTQVGFKLATDGVDGPGPAGQNLMVSVHRQTGGTPDQWEQVGPAVPVLEVDCGGAKNYTWSAGWNSGEVPLTPGETYAVGLRAEREGGTFQAFWAEAKEGGCYRMGAEGGEHRPNRLWMTVAGDGDGLLIPYNKRVHRQFRTFGGFASKWAQTYRAQGRSLAAVVLYAAVGGTQPPLARQRVAVRLRRGGADGPQVGVEKIGVGNGNYTGDASWGVFGVAFAPGEAVVEPGQTYAIEFESIENHETLHGFVNIKGQVSDERPGFNPYRKEPRESYEFGTAYLNATDGKEFDLDMQIVEYEFESMDWKWNCPGPNLLRNGDMELAEQPSGAGWRPFALVEGTTQGMVAEEGGNRLARVLGRSGTGQRTDGGYVQEVDGLDRMQTYRLFGRVRCTWAVDLKHACLVGYDPTGQVADGQAETIVWKQLPLVHGLFVDYVSEPIRPANTSISVWLRGRSISGEATPFRADFDDFALKQVGIEGWGKPSR